MFFVYILICSMPSLLVGGIAAVMGSGAPLLIGGAIISFFSMPFFYWGHLGCENGTSGGLIFYFMGAILLTTSLPLWIATAIYYLVA
jgi:hypothetical protein